MIKMIKTGVPIVVVVILLVVIVNLNAPVTAGKISPGLDTHTTTEVIDAEFECDLMYTLSSVTSGRSLLTEEFILHGIAYREGYVDLVFEFKDSFIVKDLEFSLEFLGINGNSLKVLKLGVDGVYSEFLTNLTCEVPKDALNLKITNIKFKSYAFDEVLFADANNLHTFDEQHNTDLAFLELKRINNVTISCDYKKRAEFSKAILMIHSEDGAVLNSYIMDAERYKCKIRTDFGPHKYSLCYIK